MIVLDTHALVWWAADPDRLGRKARKAVDSALESGGTFSVSSISAWEIAMLVGAKRLELSLDVDSWLAHVESVPGVQFIPVDNRIAVNAVQLEGFSHRDPADRIIVATTLGLGATLVTADERIRSYRPVRTLWD